MNAAFNFPMCPEYVVYFDKLYSRTFAAEVKAPFLFQAGPENPRGKFPRSASGDGSHTPEELIEFLKTFTDTLLSKIIGGPLVSYSYPSAFSST